MTERRTWIGIHHSSSAADGPAGTGKSGRTGKTTARVQITTASGEGRTAATAQTVAAEGHWSGQTGAQRGVGLNNAMSGGEEGRIKGCGGGGIGHM